MASRSADRESFWRTVFDEQKSSGLSVRAFCKQQSVSEPSFYAWRKKLGIGRGTKAHGLLPVSIVDRCGPGTGGSATPLLELETPSGFKLRFDRDLAAAKLREVLHVVASCSDAETGEARC